MQKLNVAVKARDIGKEPLSERELKVLFGEKNPVQFLNPRSAGYREKKLREKLLSAEEAIRLMAGDSNLIKRPLIVKGKKIVAGFDEKQIAALLQ